MNFKHEIGKNLVKLRNERGLSQDALALTTGISPRQVSRLENGYTSITVHQVFLLAKALNVTPEVITGSAWDKWVELDYPKL